MYTNIVKLMILVERDNLRRDQIHHQQLECVMYTHTQHFSYLTLKKV